MTAPSTTQTPAQKIEADIAAIADSGAKVAAAVSADATITGWQALKAICVALPLFMAVLPQLLVMVGQFGGWLKRMGGDDPKAFIARIGVTASQVFNAQTEAQDADAGGAIADDISHLPTH